MGNEAGLACWNGRKLSPSNRINPFSVPIHRYPSAVCVIAVTAPAVNPLSLPHRSRMYCEIMRFGSIAGAEEVKNTAASAATQVVIRDGISEWVSALAVLATVCEAIALEVRHGQRTEVRTAFLQAWIDHGTGDVGGTVLSGRFSGRTLDGLSDAELLDLRLDCSADADSLRILEPYLDRRLGADWRNARQPPPHGSAPRGPSSDMTREEALAVLGLAQGASDDDIKAAHRRLIQRMHPDVGGSADLAARINRAKDVLLGG